LHVCSSVPSPPSSKRGSNKNVASSSSSSSSNGSDEVVGGVSGGRREIISRIDEQDTPEALADVGLIPGAPGRPDQLNWTDGSKDSYIWNFLFSDKNGEVRMTCLALLLPAFGCWLTKHGRHCVNIAFTLYI